MAAVYTGAVTFGHDVGQAAAGWLMRLLTTDRLTMLITMGGALGTVVLAGRVRTAVAGRPFRRELVAYCLFTLALALAGYNLLFVINTEALHYPQYALLSMMLLPVVRRYGETVLLATMLGAIDEGYHHWVLNAYWHRGYWDFNDIVLNLIGAAIGVVLVATFVRPGVADFSPRYQWSDFFRSPVFLMAAAVTAVGVALSASGKITTYADPSAWVFLRKYEIDAWWYFSEYGKTYHMLLPGEGVLLSWLLVLPYVEMDRRLPPTVPELRR
jgi:hypothetical protein